MEKWNLKENIQEDKNGIGKNYNKDGKKYLKDIM